MSERETPTTLGELLLHLERSDNLRSLARQCGMAPGDLKRSLKRWRKELESGEIVSEGDPVPLPDGDALPTELEGLAAAADLGADDLGEHAALLVWTDGASRGNPGPAAIGVFFSSADGEPLCAHAETIGRATNNVAEYRAVLCALQFAEQWGLERLSLSVDSELIARQLSGQYRVKSPDLLPYFRQVQSLAGRLDRFQVRHVRRERNRLADVLASLALDGAAGRFGGD